MTTRVLSWIAIAVVGTILLCSGLVTTLMVGGGGAATVGCYSGASAAPSGPSAASTGAHSPDPGGVGPIGKWSGEQVGNAAVIISVGMRLQIPPRGWVIAVATAMQESSLINTPGGDQDSIGLFQQRSSQGWGTPAQLHDPQYAATRFYQKLQTIDGWQAMPLTEAAQKVQLSAYPDAYANWETDATQIVGTVASELGLAIPVGLEQCMSICPSAVAADSGGCADAATVFGRAQSWLTAWSGGPVPYLSSGDPGDWFRGYRRDCSGYVSMALGLDGPGLDTSELAARSTMIAKSDLRPGDLLINPAAGSDGHVVLFERWVDASMSRYYGFEQSGGGGTRHRAIPYPYFGDYPMAPYRFAN